jgi:cadmium resistance protein CadD (predicted permease)
MFDVLIAVGLFASSFAATNVDNLALLVGWLLSGQGRRRPIFIGHLLGMLAVLLLSLAFGLGANLIPIRYVGYLGVIPIGLGLKGLYELLRKGADRDATSNGTTMPATPLAIAATQVANGLDTVLVFGPLLGDSSSGVDLMLVGGFAVMTLVWFRLARFLEYHASRLVVLERYGHWISPIVLILVGLYILTDTITDGLVGP